MNTYNGPEVEKKWQKIWKDNELYKTTESGKPKYYVLDMFPYPSGAGLHVGHPLGYIASDIYARYKRHSGFEVLHPMGYDAFGLPAEQYAIQTGQHPAKTTDKNIKRYKEQLDRLGFSFDWDREFRTCDPSYYKWTQWAFIQMFEHWFDENKQSARAIKELEQEFAKAGNQSIWAANSCKVKFSASDWNGWDRQKQEKTLLDYRLAYLAEATVNWCAKLGTVLANDEVKEGLSVRGGHPVEQKKMVQWSLRISAYADRLLQGLEQVAWPASMKEVQKGWIGKSHGSEVQFEVEGSSAESNIDKNIKVFTTRPDTIFGCTFMVVAPESDYASLTTAEQKESVDSYLEKCKQRSERDRIADVQTVTGVFTGRYCIHPFTQKKLPIWIADYVLGGYGTGAIMAVPAHDSRDYAFAKKFDLPIVQVVESTDPAKSSIETESYDAKSGKLVNSDFLNDTDVSEAIAKAIKEIEDKKLGTGKVQYRLRDAVFSRQRYWGEPIPMYFENGLPKPMELADLPLELPEVDQYLPTEDGKPPLARAKDWTYKGHPLELSTMPGFAGSSAYFLRYMDPSNNQELLSKKKGDYWKQVDLYLGGNEHATGHLIYSRFWTHFLNDLGVAPTREPFAKLVNQGMIQGRSSFVYRLKGQNKFISKGLCKNKDVTAIHVDISMVVNDKLDIEAFKNWRAEFADAEFELENGEYICGYAVEKMSKSKFNVVNPDDIADKYGADTLRLYEMFLGPLEQSKPWGTQGIEGVHRFLGKFWRLFVNDAGQPTHTAKTEPKPESWKALHTCIDKVTKDIENLSFNTAVSAFMICASELAKLKETSSKILEPLAILLSPFAPHISEELWELLGNKESICFESYPKVDKKHLTEDSKTYPVSFNGKTRFTLEFSVDAKKAEIESAVMADTRTEKYIEGKSVRKFIFVPGKIINIVIG